MSHKENRSFVQMVNIPDINALKYKAFIYGCPFGRQMQVPSKQW